MILREAEEIGALAPTGDVVVLGDATGALVRAALEVVGEGGDRVIALDMSRGALEALADEGKVDPYAAAQAIDKYRLHDVSAGTSGSAGGEF